MNDLDATLDRTFPVPRTAEPHIVANTLAEIEDTLASNEQRHAELSGWVKKREKFLETFEATLFELIGPEDYDNPTERGKLAKAQLHKAKEYTEYLDKLEELQRLRKRFEYLDIRRSICQSILRRGSDGGDPHQHGGDARTQPDSS